MHVSTIVTNEGIIVDYHPFVLQKEQKGEGMLLVGKSLQKLELLVHTCIDFLARRLYAEKHYEKHFEMRCREDVSFPESSLACAR